MPLYRVCHPVGGPLGGQFPAHLMKTRLVLWAHPFYFKWIYTHSSSQAEKRKSKKSHEKKKCREVFSIFPICQKEKKKKKNCLLVILQNFEEDGLRWLETDGLVRVGLCVLQPRVKKIAQFFSLFLYFVLFSHHACSSRSALEFCFFLNLFFFPKQNCKMCQVFDNINLNWSSGVMMPPFNAY